MAINEACQVWIEQRIQEELDDGDDRSIREIGRVIAAEIETMFEAKVSPMTIYGKVRRRKIAADTNVSQTQSPYAPTVKPGDSGDIVREVDRKVRAGKSIREAAGEVAGNFGKNTEAVRKAYNRAGDPARASQAFNIVGFAITQLERLNREDPKCEEALLKLETWIRKFKEQK